MIHSFPKSPSHRPYVVFAQHRADVPVGVCIATHYSHEQQHYENPIQLKHPSSPQVTLPGAEVFERIKLTTELLFDSPEYRAENYAIIAVNSDDRHAVQLVKHYLEALACSHDIVINEITVVKSLHPVPSGALPLQQLAFDEYFAAA